MLVGSGISAVYFLNHEDASEDNPATVFENGERKNPLPASASSDSGSEASTEAAAEKDAAIANPEWSRREPDAKAPDKPLASRPSEPVKNNSKAPKTQPGNAQARGKSNRTEVAADNIVINDEEIETKDMIINENGIRMKMPPRQPAYTIVKPPLPPIDLKNLSPEIRRRVEQRRLEHFRKIKPGVIIIQTPTPKPTP